MAQVYSQEVYVQYLKRYGFVFQSSELYNGLANSWDFGPLGAVLKQQIKTALYNFFIKNKRDVLLIDTPIILNEQIWKASGHLANFTDALVDCKSCKLRFRVDHLDEQIKSATQWNPKQVNCPNCKANNWSEVRDFNLLFQTEIGVVNSEKRLVYLRPETAQGIFINFKQLLQLKKRPLPFGVAQFGKSFRNEVTPGNFLFRVREFEQFEMEWFCNPQASLSVFESQQQAIAHFLFKVLQLNPALVKQYEYDKNELAHYANKTVDFLFQFPHGLRELWGLADRGTFDLEQHQKYAKKPLDFFDGENNEHFIPAVVEPSVGIERLFYALIVSSYQQEHLEGEMREVLRLPFHLCPEQIVVLPLVNKLKETAQTLFEALSQTHWRIGFESAGSIGKRYRKADAIGTKFAITFDFESLEDQAVTIRERDSLKQVRVPIKELKAWFAQHDDQSH
ncbi:glycine--tRNA ligase [Mycoplasmoides pneumoniae]